MAVFRLSLLTLTTFARYLHAYSFSCASEDFSFCAVKMYTFDDRHYTGERQTILYDEEFDDEKITLVCSFQLNVK